MKALLFVPPTLLAGLLIGGWGPREELREVRRAHDELKKQLAQMEKGSRMDVLTRMVQIPDRARTERLRPTPELLVAAEPGTEAKHRENSLSETNRDAAVAAPATRPPLRPEDLRARIDEAKELWETRVQIARAQWLDRLKLSVNEEALFDEAVDLMNEELYYAVQRFADRLAADEAMTPEEGMRAINEMTETLVATYDTLASFVPETQRGEVAQMELSDFIDPGVAEPLISVQDKLGNLPRPQHRRPWSRR